MTRPEPYVTTTQSTWTQEDQTQTQPSKGTLDATAEMMSLHFHHGLVRCSEDPEHDQDRNACVDIG